MAKKRRRLRMHCSRLRCEPLEARRLLDGAGVSLTPDEFAVPQNGDARSLEVLANDVFGDEYSGLRQLTSASTGSGGGRIEISEDQKSILYAPPADFTGTETFHYFVDDGHSAAVTIEVIGLVSDDSYAFNADGLRRELDLLANDPFLPDYDGPRQITIVSETSLGGEVSLAADGKSVFYAMPEGTYGKDTFVYIVDDRYPARATIEIANPLASNEGEAIQNDSATSFDVVSDDPFWPGYEGERRITHVFGSQNDSVLEIIREGNAISYRPAEDFHGYETIRYVVDGRFESELRMRVHRPTRDDFVTLDVGSTDFFIPLTPNDRYRASDHTYRDVVDRVTSVGESANGATISISADGRGVLYTPPAGFTGSDTFEYIADDRYPAGVRVSVTEPVRDDFEEVYDDTVANRLDVLRNDFLGDGYAGNKRITSVGDTTEGGLVEVAVDGQSLSYTPPAGLDARRSDSFEYEVDTQFRATVRIYVSAIAVADYYRFGNPKEQLLDVLTNDHFGSNYLGPGVITEVSTPTNGGTVSIVDGGRALRYSPGGGDDTFSYTVDGKHHGDVSIVYPNRLAGDETIVDQNSGPSAVDVLANDFQSDWIQRRWGEYEGARLITAVGQPTNGGVVEISEDGKELLYTPAADFHGDDQFAYTVDGFLQASVQVHVVRRVRDDLFGVRTDSSQNSLPVLLNDLLGADYTGAGRITHVTVPSSGGHAVISDDGAAVLYTPPAGFVGTDVFTYSIDGQLKAEANVSVHDPGSERFQRFEEFASFKEYLINDAVARYEHLFGEPGFRGDVWRYNSGQDESVPASAGDLVYSETNVQVAGVDEADIVETDGNYIYSLAGRTLAITKARPADQLELLSQTPLPGSPIGQYLDGNRLAVVSRDFEILPYLDAQRPDSLVFDGPHDLYFPPYPRASRTFVTIFDVTDRKAPEVVQQTELDGNYVESRRIDDYVFLVIDSGTATLPVPETICDGDTCVFESREEYVERVQATFESLLEEALPKYSSMGQDGDLVRSGLLVQPEDIFKPHRPDSSNLISVLSFDLANDEPGLAGTSGILTSGAANVYGTLEHLYVFENRPDWQDRGGAVTRILKYSWNAADGSVRPVAAGEVPGQMVNQFSADEHEDLLRIATTVSNRYSGNYSGRPENQLFVLSDDHGILEFTSSLANLAVDETIRSVRFFGDRAFVVTYRDIDPLFALDLSNPANPEVVGHLTLPGFSQYIQFVSPNRLLTVGRNTPTGVQGPVMVSLVDVTDPIQPVRIDNFTLPRYSVSEAGIDHHAFGWFSYHDVLALPSARTYRARFDRDEDGYRESTEWVTEHELYSFRIDVEAATGEDAISLQGTIEHNSAVRRSVFIEDILYSIADTSIVASDINNPQSVASEVVIRSASDDIVPEVQGEPVRDRLNHIQSMVRADIAERYGADAASIMTITGEADSHRDRFKLVLRAADRLFAYETDGEAVLAAESDYVFPPAGTELDWHNAQNAYDVNADGIVAPGDVGLIINDVNRTGFRRLPARSVVRQIDADHYFLDVNNDGLTSALDVLHLINFINQQSHGAEGEGLVGFSPEISDQSDAEAGETGVATVEALNGFLSATPQVSGEEARGDSSSRRLSTSRHFVLRSSKTADGLPNVNSTCDPDGLGRP